MLLFGISYFRDKLNRLSMRLTFRLLVLWHLSTFASYRWTSHLIRYLHILSGHLSIYCASESQAWWAVDPNWIRPTRLLLSCKKMCVHCSNIVHSIDLASHNLQLPRLRYTLSAPGALVVQKDNHRDSLARPAQLTRSRISVSAGLTSPSSHPDCHAGT